jgi:hypothetical protein
MIAVVREIAAGAVYVPFASSAGARPADGAKAASADVGSEEVRWKA